CVFFSFFFSSRRRHTRCLSDWSSDVCSSDLMCDALDQIAAAIPLRALLLIGHQNAGLEEQPVPAPHHHAVVERPAQLGFARRIEIGRASCREKSVDFGGNSNRKRKEMSRDRG